MLFGPNVGEGQTEWKMQAGFTDATADSSGIITVVFPKPFPGGLLTIVAWGTVAGRSDGVLSKTSFRYIVTAGLVVRVYWLAIGY